MSLDKAIRNWNHKRIDKSRQLRLRLTYLLFKPFSSFLPKNEKWPLLVLRLDDKLGDGITATGLLRELKALNPQRRLIVVSGEVTAGLYTGLSFVDDVFVSKKGILNTLKLFLKLKHESYSYIINTSHILNPRTIFLTSMLQAYRKISFENSDFKIFSDFLKIDFNAQHVTDRYNNLLTLIGSSNAKIDLSYEIKVTTVDLQAAEKIISELRRKYNSIILLNSFAGGRLRNFNKETTLDIIRKLLGVNSKLAIISVANSGDHHILRNWVNELSEARWMHFPQISTVSQNVALASLCDVIVTPDTAWVHMASALKKKLIAVYREDTDVNETNSIIWAPFGTQFKVIKAETSEMRPDDINNVNTGAVVKAIEQILNES